MLAWFSPSRSLRDGSPLADTIVRRVFRSLLTRAVHGAHRGGHFLTSTLFPMPVLRISPIGRTPRLCVRGLLLPLRGGSTARVARRLRVSGRLRYAPDRSGSDSGDRKS